jgi:hypothetical protein
MPDVEEFHAYLRRVEDAFIALRGTPFVLTPADVQLILSWFDRGLPAEVVEEGVREIFQREQAKDPDRKISSLKYCSFHVEAKWKERRHRRAGAGHREGETLDVPSLMEVNAARLETFLNEPSMAEVKKKKGETWRSALEAVRGSVGDEETVETGLKALQDAITEAAWASLPKEERSDRDKALRLKLEKDLAPLSAPAQKLLVKTLLLDELAEELDIPRLTLLD